MKEQPHFLDTLDPKIREAVAKVQSLQAEGCQKRLSENYHSLTVAQEGLGVTRECESMIAQAHEHFQPELDCGKGCAYCCYPPVSASVPEVANIIGYLRAVAGEQLARETRERLEKAFQVTRGMSAQERFAVSLPCPFLVDEQCSVYPVRPLSCRGFNSTDVEVCRRNYEDPKNLSPVNAFSLQTAWAWSLKTGTLKGLKEMGLNPTRVDLTKAAYTMFDDPDGVLEDWLDKKPVLADCEAYSDR